MSVGVGVVVRVGVSVGLRVGVSVCVVVREGRYYGRLMPEG